MTIHVEMRTKVSKEAPKINRMCLTAMTVMLGCTDSGVEGWEGNESRGKPEPSVVKDLYH